MISMIVAKDINGVIGKDNKLIWRIPEDLRHFKNKTLGKTIVMGRKTYESIGRPLPGRRNIVMTKDNSFNVSGVDVVNSVDEVLALLNTNDEVVIIGGDSVYKQFMEHADILYVTEIDHKFEGDTFFPEITEEWELVDSAEGKESGDKYKYYFNKYEKRWKFWYNIYMNKLPVYICIDVLAQMNG